MKIGKIEVRRGQVAHETTRQKDRKYYTLKSFIILSGKRTRDKRKGIFKPKFIHNTTKLYTIIITL